MSHLYKYSFRSYERTVLPPAPFGFYVIQEPVRYEINDRPFKGPQPADQTTARLGRLLKEALATEDFTPVLESYGVGMLAKMGSTSELIQTFDLQEAEAERLFSILSIGRIVFKDTQHPIIRGRDDIFDRYRSMGSLNQEQLVIALVNSRYMLVHDELLARGSTEVLQLSPLEVFECAILRKIHSVVLIHNHSTGDSTPSAADYEFTKRMQTAAATLSIDLLDHVIIGKDACSSALS